MLDLRLIRRDPDAVREALARRGDADRLDEASREAIRGAGTRILTPTTPRVLAVAYLAWQRLQRGDSDDLDALVPLYLRAPAIGPQPPRP
jgi:hypothetical protein